MKVLGLCFDSTSAGVATHHDLWLVGLSFLVAAFASYCSLDMAERMRSASRAARRFWMEMSGITLGGGIWSMHFIGMTAFNTPLEQGYDPGLTFISGVVAIAAVIAGLAVLGRRPTVTRLILSGAIVGLGVVMMHYVGMQALRIPGQVAYRPGLFGVSVVIALTAATVALWLAVTLNKIWHRAIAAVVMAIAICGMHYTAMAGTVLIAWPISSPIGHVVDKAMLAALVTIGIVGLLVIALVLAFLDRRIAASAEEESRLRELNAALDEARAHAESATRLKGHFLATMSHELRTPMNGVLGMLEVVLRSDLTAEQRDHVATAHEQAAKLLALLNDVLDFSKIEAGQLELENISFSVRQVVDEVASMLANQAQQKGISIDAVVDRDVPEWLVGDPTRFRQILTNLVSNAVKFTQLGGVAIAISSERLADVDHVRVTVRDTGIGLSEMARARLFTRFAQADASTTRQFGGTGLGLAICRELVTRMGGEIGVESELGRGSCFWLVVPAPSSAAPEWIEPAVADLIVTTRPLHILIAEDNLVNKKVVRLLLAPHNYALTFVGDGRQALNAVTSGRFDLVLMDVSMPVMDGPTAARAIRKLEGPSARVPIIALTANAMAGDREAYLAAGMNDYVSKPLQIAALLSAITRQSAQASVASAVGPLAVVANPLELGSHGAGSPTSQDDLLKSNADLDDLIVGLQSTINRSKVDAPVARRPGPYDRESGT